MSVETPVNPPERRGSEVTLTSNMRPAKVTSPYGGDERSYASVMPPTSGINQPVERRIVAAPQVGPAVHDVRRAVQALRRRFKVRATSSGAGSGGDLSKEQVGNGPSEQEDSTIPADAGSGGPRYPEGGEPVVTPEPPEEPEWRIMHRDPRSPRTTFRALGRVSEEDMPHAIRTTMPDTGLSFDVSRNSTTPPSFETSRHSNTIAESIQRALDSDESVPIHFADIGTGSGVGAGTVAYRLREEIQREDPRVKVVATDLMPRAIADATVNMAQNNISGVTFGVGDGYNALPTDYVADVVFSNPPIQSEEEYREGESLRSEAQKAFHPESALNAGQTNTAFYGDLVRGAGDHLSSRGVLIMQHLDYNYDEIMGEVSSVFDNETVEVKRLAGERQTALAIGYRDGLINYFPGETVEIPGSGEPNGNGGGSPQSPSGEGVIPAQRGPSEPMTGPGDRDSTIPPGEPGDTRFSILTPSGELVDPLELIRRSRSEGAAELNTGVFKSGDLIVFKGRRAEEGANGVVFEITKAEWQNLGIGQTPRQNITGRLYGLDLPDNVSGKEASFRQSGFSGMRSYRTPDIISTDRAPVFVTKDGEEVALPAYVYSETFRQHEQLEPVNATQLDAEARTEIPAHRELLSQADQIIAHFGYDLHDINPTVRPNTRDPLYRDDHYVIHYITGGNYDGGNRMTIFNRETGRWIQVSYHNGRNEDMLQVAVADLSELDTEKLQRAATGDSAAIYRSGRAITTFATSNNYGLESVDFLPSEQDAQEQLGVPAHTDLQIHRPHIHISPGGQTSIPENGQNTMYRVVEERHPGLDERVNASISTDLGPDATPQVILGDKRIQLPNPRQLMGEVTEYLSESL